MKNILFLVLPGCLCPASFHTAVTFDAVRHDWLIHKLLPYSFTGLAIYADVFLHASSQSGFHRIFN